MSFWGHFRDSSSGDQKLIQNHRDPGSKGRPDMGQMKDPGVVLGEPADFRS